MASRRLLPALCGPCLVVTLFLLTMVFLTVKGRMNRHVLDTHEVYRVEQLKSAFFLWHDQDLHGRIILYFDRHFTIDTDFIESLNLRFAVMEHSEPDANSRNFLIMALYHDIFRKIYHVVPDSSWPEVRDKLSRYPFVAFDGKRFRLTIEGSPVIVTRLADLPHFSEKVVIFLNNEYRAEYDARALDALLEDPVKSDVVVIAKIAE